ncbi:MAG TPA: hypothetical protein VHF26_14350, partial [Trebonia sp.]|nr:hypothetical protein [Trebonia sp.]
MRRRDIGSDDGEPDGAGRRDWVVAVAVDHGGEQGQPRRRADHAGTDSPADAPGPPEGSGTRAAVRDSGGEPGIGSRRPAVLADPSRRVAEHWMRRALVERAY